MKKNTTPFTEFTEQEVQEATKEIRDAFIIADKAWNACGENDSMGIYRFLTGKNRHKMNHLFKQLEKPIAVIIVYGEYKIEENRLALLT